MCLHRYNTILNLIQLGVGRNLLLKSCTCVYAIYAHSLSHIRLFVAPWTIAHQAPPSMEFSRQEYQSAWPFPSPCHLPYPGTEPTSLALLALASRFFTTSTIWEAYICMRMLLRHFSRVRLCVTPETAAHQAPPSLRFSRQEHWSGLPFPSPIYIYV